MVTCHMSRVEEKCRWIADHAYNAIGERAFAAKVT